MALPNGSYRLQCLGAKAGERRDMGKMVRSVVVAAVVSLALLTVSCAGGQRESRAPSGTDIQCPYCKTVFKF